VVGKKTNTSSSVKKILSYQKKNRTGGRKLSVFRTIAPSFSTRGSLDPHRHARGTPCSVTRPRSPCRRRLANPRIPRRGQRGMDRGKWVGGGKRSGEIDGRRSGEGVGVRGRWGGIRSASTASCSVSRSPSTARTSCSHSRPCTLEAAATAIPDLHQLP
jgi:hypothetical protein